jgi:hypothetical protein
LKPAPAIAQTGAKMRPGTADKLSAYQDAHDLRERGEFEAARARYREHLAGFAPGARDKAVLKGLVGQIHCANGLEDWREMEALARRIVEDFPQSPAGPLYLGEALLRQARHGEAVTALESAAALDPAAAEPRALLQVARAGQGGERRAPRRTRIWPPGVARFADLKHLVRRYLLDGLPDGLRIRPEHRMMTLGSCFAENLARRLQACGYGVHHEPIGEEVNTTYANRYLLEWVEHGPASAVTRAMEAAYGPMLRERLAEAVAASDVFILTFGVAPCFFADATGEFVFTQSESSITREFLNERCSMRTTTVAENVINIRRIIESLRRLSGRDPGIVLTVSPVPLSGTTELSSAIIADCISKSTLRLACHEVLTASPHPRVHYWPSFEIVRWIGPHLGPDHPPPFGDDDGNSRHVSAWLVETIIDLFLERHAKGAPERMKA